MFVQAGWSHVCYAPGVTLQVITVATLKEIHLITLLCWASWVTGYILCKEQISHSSRIFRKWLIEEKGTAENSVSNGYLAEQHAMEYMELEEGSISWIKWAWSCLGNSQSKSRSLKNCISAFRARKGVKLNLVHYVSTNSVFCTPHYVFCKHGNSAIQF